MIDIAAAASSPEEIWARLVASHALEEAVDGLYSAAALLGALADACDWRVTAGQLVRARILAFRAQALDGIASVRDLHGQLDRAVS